MAWNFLYTQYVVEASFKKMVIIFSPFFFSPPKSVSLPRELVDNGIDCARRGAPSFAHFLGQRFVYFLFLRPTVVVIMGFLENILSIDIDRRIFGIRGMISRWGI